MPFQTEVVVKDSARMNRWCFFGGWPGLVCWLGLWAVAEDVSAAAPATTGFRADQILVQPGSRPGAALALRRFHQAHGLQVLREFPALHGLQVVRVPAGGSVTHLIAQLQHSGLVTFAEPDYEIHACAAPNDPLFTNGTLYGLNNISATNAWDTLTAASNIVVAVLDTGVRYTHEDLAANMWTNPADGSYGWNAVANNNDPADDGINGGHGTQVAGVLGAVGNNGKGAVGVAWRVRIMACKCLNSAGAGSDSDLITCINFARTNGAKIINASLGGTNFSAAVSNAIVSARDAGIVFVAAAGNGNPQTAGAGTDLDLNPFYPACYQIDNIVSVAYTTQADTLGQFSNYGAQSVSLAAPGDQIYSTTSASDSSYSSSFYIGLHVYGTGTSYAAPYVAGACALLMAQYPADDYHAIIARLLGAVDPLPSLAGKCRTGGRLNLNKILRTIRLATAATNGSPFTLRVDGGLNRTCVVETTTDFSAWTPVFTNSSTADGTFDFSDREAASLPQRFYRAAANP